MGDDILKNFTVCALCVALSTSAGVAQGLTGKAAEDFAIRKQQLMQSKDVKNWPQKAGAPGKFTVRLSVTECTWLGGTVVFWPSCGDTNMKCVGGNGREMCIDAIK